jgi:hypothetical protein
MRKPNCNEAEAKILAGITVSDYMTTAVTIIDRELGEGYAAKNPGLIGVLVKAMAMDYNTTSQSEDFYELASSIDLLALEIKWLKNS